MSDLGLEPGLLTPSPGMSKKKDKWCLKSCSLRSTLKICKTKNLDGVNNGQSLEEGLWAFFIFFLKFVLSEF